MVELHRACVSRKLFPPFYPDALVKGLLGKWKIWVKEATPARVAKLKRVTHAIQRRGGDARALQEKYVRFAPPSYGEDQEHHPKMKYLLPEDSEQAIAALFGNPAGHDYAEAKTKDSSADVNRGTAGHSSGADAGP